MESMRRSEANSSHHPNKVAVNSLATESNKQSSGSGSTLNNNKLSYNQQQKLQQKQQISTTATQHKEKQKSNIVVGTAITNSNTSSNTSSSTTTSSSSGGSSTSSESKDINFEYDDNEWDVGGIGDLIIDLDADIEKSSSIAGGGATTVPTVAVVGAEATPNTSVASTGGAISNLVRSLGSNSTTTTINTKNTQISILNTNEKSSSGSSSSSSSINSSSSTSSSPTTVSSSKSSSLSSTALFSPISKVLNQVCNKNQTPTTNKASSAAGGIITSTTASPIAIKSTAIKQQSKSAVQQQNLKLQQPSLVAQLTSKSTVAAVTTVATVPQSTESKFNLISGSANKISGQQGNNNNSSASGIKLSTVSPVLSGSLVVGQQQQQQTVGTVGGNQTTAVSSSMSSQPSGGQGAGKSATKMSIDHQATLDKGLKMKIKRTKPGTKTSEAKHEIVKAEQNGTSSNPLDDNTNNNSNQSTGTTNSSTGNSGGNGNGKNKHNQQSANQQTTPTVQTLTAQQPITNTPTTTKRGSSGHRRDKTRDKTPHSRDKSEHNSNSSSGSGGGGSSNSNNSSSSSHSNSTSNSNDRSTTNSNSSGNNSCSCAHEVNGGGGIQPPCTNVSCIRNRTTSGGIVAGSLEQQSNNSNSIAQRISGPTGNQNVQNSNNSSASSNLTVNSGSGGGGTITGSGIFNNNGLIGGNTQNSGGNANAPGPPIKDGKINLPGSSINNHQQQPQQQHQSSIQIPNPTSASLTTSAQQQTIGLNPLIGGGGGSTNSQISSNSSKCIPSGLISATVHHTISVAANSTTGSSTGNTTTGSHNCDDGTLSPPAAKRIKTDPKDMVDICVGTSVGTITEPDCLGPCEPGTSVTLEGIVWHETEGGVLVVNVTWRGKTYVGTLLDCTRHDWAPPRFCDSPTEELDSRTPKGRGKRGRSANLTPDLSNFTETRSSVHSKLRNGGAKGRGGRGVTTGNATATTTTPSTTTTAVISGNGNGTTSTTGSVTSTPTCVSTTVSTSIIGNITSSSTNSSNSTNTPSTSPTAFLPPRPEKRKSKDESPSPPVNGESDMLSNNNGGTSIIPGSSATIQSTQIIVNPITGLNVQISNKKCKTASPCAISPVLLECPEQDCNKKYKHANGLRYHQSHAHGSGSMDEDSSTMPESPVTAVPPTTPSPNPPSTPQPTSQVTQTTSTIPIIGAGNNNIPVNVTVSSNGGITGNGPSPIMTTVSSSSSSGIVNVPGAITAGVPSSAVSVTPSGAGLLSSTSVIPSNLSTATLITPIPANPQPSPSSQIPQHTIAGGSITAGISGQALSQHQQQQQQHSMLVGTVPNQGLLSGGNNQIIPEASGQQQQQSSMPAQQQHTPSNVHSNLLTTARGDGPIKPGVLRFGPTPPVDINPNLLSTQQSPLRPTPTAAMAPNSGSIGTPETAHQPSYGQAQAASQQGIPVNKSQNYGGKQKKNRKSPVPGEFDSSTSRDDVQSPAYSDISDDSTPVVEADLTDKTQSVKHPDVVKKPLEGPPPQIPQLGAYGMYQFYAQQPYMVPPQQPDHQGSVGGLGSSGPKQQIQSQQQQQQSIPSGIPNDPYNKNKEPPLDLMTKPPLSHSNNDQQQQNNGKDLGPCGPSAGGPPINLGPQNPTKPMPHFYPFNYMPPGYPYNVDPNYGPVSMVSDDNNKIGGPGQNLPPPLKDDRNKESQSPHGNLDHGKMTGQSPQIIPTKLIKNEPQLKDIKQEPNNSHSMHLKDSPVQSLSGYPGLYQRHPLLSVPQQPTPQHLSREDELRRYYIYPDQRRSSGSNNSLSLGNKDEPPSPSSLMHHQQQQSQISQQLQQSPQSQQQQQQSNSQKSSKSGSQSSNQKATNLIKDIKDEKDIKVKQEGQKPTMETQGPPPPPTSQYFLHPSYISPGPFGFDPTTHPMYRNVLMSAGPYNPPPYHLSMGRFHAPEDLSRNPGTKALDALHHAAQYYNNTQHKIHELAERAMKSPNSNNNNNSGGGSGNNSGGSKTVNVSSPNISQQPSSGNGPNGPNNGPGGPNNGPGGPPNLMTSSSGPGGSLNLQPPPGSLGSMSGPGGPLGGSVGGGGGNVNSSQKSSDVISGKSGGGDPSGKSGPIGVGGIGGPPGSVGGPGGIGPGGVGPGGIVGGPGGPDSRSPPPQRHVHTHHHTHVGLGYPMYPAPYVSNVSAAVLASQQAAAVAVINPFPPGPTK